MRLKKARIEAVILSILLVGTMLIIPVSSIDNDIEENTTSSTYRSVHRDSSEEVLNLDPFWLDRWYLIDNEPAPINRDDNDDAGYKKDAGDKISRSDAIYVSELIDDTPGRGRYGEISSSDDEDWYDFSVCEGQDFTITMTPPSGFDIDIGLWDDTEVELVTSTNSGSATETINYEATYSGQYFVKILYISGTGTGRYSFDITMDNQNDADTGDDAGDDFSSATLLSSEGEYYGYLDMDDAYDWYKFDVDSGKGIHFNLEVRQINYLSDCDISLYNPSGELVHEERYYYSHAGPGRGALSLPGE